MLEYNKKNILIITVPRSGHHLLEKSLQYYFNSSLSYCEFYSCCKKIPCSKGKKIQKNHDWDLSLKINNNFKYIIQYRKFEESLVSLFKLYCCEKNLKNEQFFSRVYKDDIKFNEKSFLKFSNFYLIYYKKFLSKYIFSNNFFTINYTDLLRNYEQVMNNVISIIQPTKKLNLNKLKHIKSKIKIHEGKNYKTFRFYNKKTFDNFEKEIKGLKKKFVIK